MTLSVIIPMYNESNCIEANAKTLSDYMAEHFDDYEIIYVNDGSTDDCLDKLQALHLPGVTALTYETNQGKGYAVRYGMTHAKGDVRLFTDTDLAYGVEVVERFYSAFQNNPQTDIVIGSRNISKDGYEGYSFVRKVASKIYIGVLNVFIGFKLSDSQCGIKAYRAQTAEKIFGNCEVNRFAFDIETLMIAKKIGCKIDELPVKVIHHGESKVHLLRDTYRMLRDLTKIKKRINKLEI